MCHHKAPHRGWEPSASTVPVARRTIPEPATLWDDYATRTDALHENRQRVFDDLTWRDLKMTRRPIFRGQALAQWLNAIPREAEVEQDDGARS